jgi:FkbM family methyltransferase
VPGTDLLPRQGQRRATAAAGLPEHPRVTAIVVPSGPVEPTVRLAAELTAIRRIGEVVVVARDGAARPADLPAGAAWLSPRGPLGVAGGFRHGADARPDSDVYVLLADAVLLSERTVEGCLALLARDGVGIVGPTLVDADGIHPGAHRLTPLYGVPRRRRAARPGEPAEVAFVGTAVLFIRAACHRQVPMDTRYFLGYEAADLARRARSAGWRVMVSPAQAWRTGGGGTPLRTHAYFTTRNRIWFARLYGGPVRGGAVAAWLAAGPLPRSAASDLLRGRDVGSARFAWHGLIDGLGTLPPADRPFPDEPRPARWERLPRPPGAGRAAVPAVLTSPARAASGTGRDRARAVWVTRAAPLTGGTQTTYLTMASGLADDLRRIAAVAGPWAAARFAAGVLRHAPTVARSRRLDVADRAMAGRDWTFRPQPGVRLRLPGSVFGHAREVYCRQAYAARPGYAPARGEAVVDLGAGEGLFSMLAAAAGASLVLAVETRGECFSRLSTYTAANGLTGRITMDTATVTAGGGTRPGTAREPVGNQRGGVPACTVAELLARHGLRRVDLVKIDLDGAEFALFAEPAWLDRVDRIVMEVHPEHGDPAALQRVLTEHGFASVLLDNGLAPTPTLTRAASGYLYARHRRGAPHPRAGSVSPVTAAARPDGAA